MNIQELQRRHNEMARQYAEQLLRDQIVFGEAPGLIRANKPGVIKMMTPLDVRGLVVRDDESIGGNVTDVKKTIVGDGAASYVKLMANNIGLDFNSAEVQATIEQAKTMTFQEVNKAMFALAKAGKIKQPKELTTGEIGSLTILGRSRIDEMVASAEAKKTEHLNNVEVYSKRCNDELAKVAKCTMDLIALKGGAGVDFVKQVMEVVQNPFYELHKVTNEFIEFTTKNVILRWEKKAAAVKYEIDLGQFLVRIYPTRGDANVFPFKDNIRARGNYPHPHIQSMEGRMCWGNAIDSIRKMATDFDIRPAMQAIEAFLHTYNEGSAYSDIYRFYERQKAKQDGKLGIHYDIANTKKMVLLQAPSTYMDSAYTSKLADGMYYRPGSYFYFFAHSDGQDYYIELEDGSFVEANDFHPNWHPERARIPTNTSIEGGKKELMEYIGINLDVSKTNLIPILAKLQPADVKSVLKEMYNNYKPIDVAIKRLKIEVPA